MLIGRPGDRVKTMEQTDIDRIYALMEFEAARTEPPRDFPDLPDLPGGRYTDPRFFELEQQHIWRKSWLLASHIDEVPEPGCYRLWENAGQPVIIVHEKSAEPGGKINAFYNTCSHRGAPIVTDSFGKRPLLTCKYHGWSYTHSGDLIALRDEEDFRDLDKSCRSLQSIRCERFGNFIFVNFDDNAPSLLDWLGPIAQEWKEFQFDKCRLSARHIFDLDCNWKIAMEANTEVYHVPSIHPNTVAPMLDNRRNVNTLYPNGHGRMIAPTPEKNLASRTERLPGAPEIETVSEIGRTCTQSYGIFPNWVSPLSTSWCRLCNSGPTVSTSVGSKPGPPHPIGAMALALTCGPKTTAKSFQTCCLKTPNLAPGFRSLWSHGASRAYL